MKTLPTILLVCSSVAMAQGPKSPATSGAPSPEAGIPATRYIGDDVGAHVESLRQGLAINRRERCPFGLFQVPGKTPVIKNPLSKMIKRTPFSDYIDQIEISMINSGDKEFYVKARVFRLGQQFPIVSGGERLQVRVEEIESSKVSFRNLKTGEMATKRFNLLPAGVTANTNTKVPGVTPDGRGDALPLHLETTPDAPTP